MDKPFSDGSFSLWAPFGRGRSLYAEILRSKAIVVAYEKTVGIQAEEAGDSFE